MTTPLSTTAVNLNAWTMITATFIVTGNAQSQVYVYFGKTRAAYQASTQNIPPVSDIVHFGGPGGFIGRLSQISIYTPGATRVGGIF